MVSEPSNWKEELVQQVSQSHRTVVVHPSQVQMVRDWVGEMNLSNMISVTDSMFVPAGRLLIFATFQSRMAQIFDSIARVLGEQANE